MPNIELDTDHIMQLVSNGIVDKLSVPKRTSTRQSGRFTSTVYDNDVLTSLQEWATANGTNLSSLVSHGLDIIYQILLVCNERNQAQTRIQKFVYEEQDRRMPRLDAPIAELEQWLKDNCKSVESYHADVEAPLQAVIKACDNRFRELRG